MNSLPDILIAGQKLRSGEVTAVDILDFCLRWIEVFEPQVQAWVTVDRDGAIAAAKQADRELRDGRDRGLLHGIPVGIKDIIDVAGMRTGAGSKLFEDHMAAEDAPIVARLRDAGAVIVGKTVTTELACFDPPPTRNPWNVDHTPGGSSSGSSAAVALEMCCAAIGSQTGGSITRPASFCGVAGMKPTIGAVDMSSVVPISRHLDHVGPIARTVGDLALVFAAIAKASVANGTDDWTLDSLPAPPPLHFIREYFHDRAAPSIAAATQAAYQKLLAAGATMTELPLPPSFEPVHAMHRTIMAVEAAETHCETFEQHAKLYGPKVSELIQEGLATFAVEYALALRHYEGFRRDVDGVFAPGVFAMTPATVTTATPTLETTGDPSFNSPWSYCGLPTVNLPCGLAGDGMPSGLQLIGPRGADRELLAVAAWCEHVLDFREKPSMLSDAAA